KFDLSSIPSNATIISANLYLYSYPPPTLNGNFSEANVGSNNTLFVQQVVANWSPSSVNWANQPATTTTNQVNAPSTTQSMLDLNLDVKNMVASMVSTNANYGFMLKLENEVKYTSRLLVSSYNTTYAAKHPKLVVVYK
ncbi:MAG TPA: DNRLRE domain-containing protein, partial [Chitinophagaceae bacterium]|nr:DNRLRE domain-containing protein [Chitinophagaceae bacterium]